MRILLVTEDEQLGAALQAALQPAGYATDRARDTARALAALETRAFAAMLLDTDGPALSAAEVLKGAQDVALPVIAMTGHNSVEHRVASLDLGADDCLLKPFKSAEMLARLRAVVRRARGHTRSVIVHGEIELDMGARSVRQAGHWVQLTPREYQVLSLLMARIGRIVTKAEIEAQIYEADAEAESNTIEAAIYAVRKKLGKDLIGTVRGVGYVIAGK